MGTLGLELVAVKNVSELFYLCLSLCQSTTLAFFFIVLSCECIEVS